MVCFCKNTASALGQTLPSISATANLDLSFNADVQAIADWLTNAGLPAAPWSPQPGWLELQLPSVPLSASEVATISATAYLRAQVLAQSGMDLLVPAQANAFVRLAATLSARLSDLAGQGAAAGSAAAAWPQLATALNATSQVEAALTTGLLASPSSGMLASPASVPSPASMTTWQPFLAQMQLLLPLTTLSAQLPIDPTAELGAQLSPMLQAIADIPMPQVPVSTFSLMATLSASLNAIAQLSASLGMNPLQAGIPAVQAAVAQRTRAVAQLAMAQGIDLTAVSASLPSLPVTVNPPSLATSATVDAVKGLNAEALASLDLQIPPAASLPVLTVGLPTASLAAQLSALGFAPATAPCGSICDARDLLNATLSGGVSA